MTTIGHGVAYWSFPLALRIHKLEPGSVCFFYRAYTTERRHFGLLDYFAGWHFGLPDYFTGWHFGLPNEFTGWNLGPPEDDFIGWHFGL